jgi:hypothetical protein
MRNSREPQHVSIWPMTRLETAVFVMGLTLTAIAGAMWAAGV